MPQISQVFGALADPTRLAIIERLMREGEKSTGDLAKPFAMSKPAISRHIRVLEESGLIERRVVRQFRMCRVRAGALDDVSSWIEQQRQFWNASFDRLDKLLDERKACDEQ
jgi:DNA-binding transcriptional ArsR family regulator